MKICISFFLGGHCRVLVSWSMTWCIKASLPVPQSWPLHHQLGWKTQLGQWHPLTPCLSSQQKSSVPELIFTNVTAIPRAFIELLLRGEFSECSDCPADRCDMSSCLINGWRKNRGGEKKRKKERSVYCDVTEESIMLSQSTSQEIRSWKINPQLLKMRPRAQARVSG